MKNIESYIVEILIQLTILAKLFKYPDIDSNFLINNNNNKFDNNLTTKSYIHKNLDLFHSENNQTIDKFKLIDNNNNNNNNNHHQTNLLLYHFDFNITNFIDYNTLQTHNLLYEYQGLSPEDMSAIKEILLEQDIDLGVTKEFYLNEFNNQDLTKQLPIEVENANLISLCDNKFEFDIVGTEIDIDNKNEVPKDEKLGFFVEEDTGEKIFIKKENNTFPIDQDNSTFNFALNNTNKANGHTFVQQVSINNFDDTWLKDFNFDLLLTNTTTNNNNNNSNAVISSSDGNNNINNSSSLVEQDFSLINPSVSSEVYNSTFDFNQILKNETKDLNIFNDLNQQNFDPLDGVRLFNFSNNSVNLVFNQNDLTTSLNYNLNNEIINDNSLNGELLDDESTNSNDDLRYSDDDNDDENSMSYAQADNDRAMYGFTHNHTYLVKSSIEEYHPHSYKNKKAYLDSTSNRISKDERLIKDHNIKYSIDTIVNSDVEQFNEILRINEFTTEQLTIIKDIRRRGKNKVAAQVCRKRKIDSIDSLKDEVDALKRRKEELQNQRHTLDSQMKQFTKKIDSIYKNLDNSNEQIVIYIKSLLKQFENGKVENSKSTKNPKE